MRHIWRVTLLSIALAVAAIFPPATQAADKLHRVAMQVDVNDPAVMNQALNNASNMASQYAAAGEKVEIEIVTYGPGLNMLRDDTSPVKARLTAMKQAIPSLSFAACAVTKRGMEKTEGHEITLIPEATVVPSGAIRLVELQEQGWSYLKP